MHNIKTIGPSAIFEKKVFPETPEIWKTENRQVQTLITRSDPTESGSNLVIGKGAHRPSSASWAKWRWRPCTSVMARQTYEKNSQETPEFIFRNFPSLTRPEVVVSNLISPTIRAAHVEPYRKPKTGSDCDSPAAQGDVTNLALSPEIENHHFVTSWSRSVSTVSGSYLAISKGVRGFYPLPPPASLSRRPSTSDMARQSLEKKIFCKVHKNRPKGKIKIRQDPVSILQVYSKSPGNGLVSTLAVQEPKKAKKKLILHLICLWAELWSRDIRIEKLKLVTSGPTYDDFVWPPNYFRFRDTSGRIMSICKLSTPPAPPSGRNSKFCLNRKS